MTFSALLKFCRVERGLCTGDVPSPQNVQYTFYYIQNASNIQTVNLV